MRRSFTLAVVTALAIAFGSASAAGADRIYWSNLDGQSIAWANLDGKGGAQFPTGSATVNGPMGLAVDPVAGKLYWSNWGGEDGVHDGHQISTASLDGNIGSDLVTNEPLVHSPHGVALDLPAGKIFWTNGETNSINYANFDGTSPAILPTGAATLGDPRGLAIDLAAGKIYWANHMGNRISWANLDGSGGGDLATGAATVSSPEGVAIDPVDKRIWWGSFGDASTISWANLDGSGGADIVKDNATFNYPHGVALDPVARKIYWTNYGGNVISWAYLDKNGQGDIPVPGAPINGPNLPVLLEVPAGTGKPVVSGSGKPGSKLHCSQGSWGADFTESLDYRSPRSFSYRWTRNGHHVKGGTSGKIKTHSVADYRCIVTASNTAGSTNQTSSALGVFKLGHPQLDTANGTALLPVTFAGKGKVKVRGTGKAKRAAMRLRGRTVAAKRHHHKPKKLTRTVKVRVKAKGKAKRKLRKAGSVKVKAKIIFHPKRGTASSRFKTVKLVLR